MTIPYFCVILSISNISKAMTKRVSLERFYREASVAGQQARRAERKQAQNKEKMASERRTELE